MRGHAPTLPDLRALAIVALLAVAALYVIGLPDTAQPVRAQAPMPRFWTQEVWLITSQSLVAPDGASADATSSLLTSVDSAIAGPPLDLGHGGSYQDAPSLAAATAALDASGTPLSSIALHVGEIALNGRRLVAILASPDLSQARIGLDPSGAIALDFGALLGVQPSGGTLSYAVMQTLPPDDPSGEEGLDDLNVLAQRCQNGEYQTIGVPQSDGSVQPAVVAGVPLSPATAPDAPGEMHAYLQAGSRASFPPLPPPSDIFTSEMGTNPLSELWRSGKGAVPPSQAARDNDPRNQRHCIPYCDVMITGNGSATFGEKNIWTASISLNAVGTMGFQTKYQLVLETQSMLNFPSTDNQLTENYTPNGMATGCTVDSTRATNISSFTWQKPLVARIHIDRSWVTVDYLSSDGYFYLPCSKPDSITGKPDIYAELHGPMVPSFPCRTPLSAWNWSTGDTLFGEASVAELDFTCPYDPTNGYPGSGSLTVKVFLVE